MLFDRRRDPLDLTRRIDALQVEALQCTGPGEAATPLNQAGDLLLKAGDVRNALDMYGRAIDSLVDADRFEAAMGLCKKIIRTTPDVVRARCTLAWLAIAVGFTGELSERVGDYVSAAEQAGRQRIALKHVRLMGEVVDMHELRMMLAEYLMHLGDDRASNDLFGQVFEERNTGQFRELDVEQRWREVREATRLTPQRLAATVKTASGASLSDPLH